MPKRDMLAQIWFEQEYNPNKKENLCTYTYQQTNKIQKKNKYTLSLARTHKHTHSHAHGVVGRT
jgi:hypothetical protein